MRKIIGILVVLSSIYAAGEAIAEETRPGCHVCGMYIDQYQKTAGALTYTGGKTVQSCGIACLLRMVADAGGPDAFVSILVKDWMSGTQLPAGEAVYVLSSKIIPDMLPSIIAFKDRREAEHFIEKQGGELISFSQALLTISPAAMTMPVRIKTAAVPSKGSSGIGIGYMSMKMDTVKIGSDSADPEDFVQRPGQMMGPKEMKAQSTMLMANYGVSDRLAMNVKAAYVEKEMDMYAMGGNKINTFKNSGLSDIYLSFRYNVFKSNFYNHFTTLLAEASLPTGDFDQEFLSRPGLQIGSGDFTFGGGLLYTYRFSDLWLHTMASYTHKLENSDNYKFGDESRLGLALHYTPNYDWMFGVETDWVHFDRNEWNGTDVGNSGGVRSNLTGVASWRFLTALGGNFNLRLTAGLPLYEDLNHATKMGMETVQLGGGWSGSLSVSFKRRFAPK
jgi:nitrous oxide reductase accessory protein NosL